MRKSEIKPLISLICSSRQINHLLLLIHGIPLTISMCIPLHIIYLRAHVQKDVSDENRQQDLVSALVPRSVVFLVDVGGDYTGCLHAHVVESRRDSAGSHGV
jgi:hypothetical protein